MAAQGFDPRDFLWSEQKYSLYLRLAGGSLCWGCLAHQFSHWQSCQVEECSWPAGCQNTFSPTLPWTDVISFSSLDIGTTDQHESTRSSTCMYDLRTGLHYIHVCSCSHITYLIIYCICYLYNYIILTYIIHHLFSRPNKNWEIALSTWMSFGFI